MIAWGRARLSKSSSIGSRDRASGSVTDAGSVCVTAGASTAIINTATATVAVAPSAEAPGVAGRVRRAITATAMAAAIHRARRAAECLTPAVAIEGTICHDGHNMVN